ncbi:DDB1- and CUL4-associated factor 10 homolog [Anopheles bellator]|uniref:DDB1- and CUL4-associated factor 10 homolog n=1 Tax=Anopheles bellator TaxID=139047 RepID=UPI0026484332|nr:DDB1- and CUL4-associated factor 10 homolog [Anopheles bellator]
MSFYAWWHRRERGIAPRVGESDIVYRTLYESFEPRPPRPMTKRDPNTLNYGGIFCLEFSPDGSMLAGGCEHNGVILLDPVTEKRICGIKNAHYDSINCVKYLDNVTFATGSDDDTIAVWDTRNLRTKLRSLQGHNGWVKNIDYSKKHNMLITSAFDGTVCGWELNNYTEQGCVHRRLLYVPGLVRCRLTPDETRMVLTTSGGYLMIVNNLNLPWLSTDLEGFQPNVYRLMQKRQQTIAITESFNRSFYPLTKRNRVELVTDFPVDDDAEIISTLQIHPHGWCALSRNTTYDNRGEFTTIHDIQALSDTAYNRYTKDKDEEEDGEDDDVVEEDGEENDNEEKAEEIVSHQRYGDHDYCREPLISENQPSTATRTIDATMVREELPGGVAAMPPANVALDLWATQISFQERVLGMVPLRLFFSRRSGRTVVSYTIPQPDSNDSDNELKKHHEADTMCKNTPRLLYYAREPSLLPGIIKEASFSPDGRIVCSPFLNGVRLLAFNENCAELPRTINTEWNDKPQTLHVLKKEVGQQGVVACSTFSPRFPLLVTGCLKGNIVWHTRTMQ